MVTALLRQRVDEPRGDDLHLVHLAASGTGRARGARWPALRETSACRRRRTPRRAAARVRATNCAALRPAVMNTVVCRIELRRQAEHVGVERAAQALVGGDQDHRALAHLAHLEQRMRESRRARRSRCAGCGRAAARTAPRVERGLLRLAHLRRRHHLHRLGDLRGAADRLDAPAKIAWAAHRTPIHASLPRLLELVGRGLQLGRQLVAERLLLRDLAEQLRLSRRRGSRSSPPGTP